MNAKLTQPGTVRRITQLLARLHPAGWDSPRMIYGRFLCSFLIASSHLSPHISHMHRREFLCYICSGRLPFALMPNFLVFSSYVTSLISSLYIGRANERASTNLLSETGNLGMDFANISFFTRLGLFLGQRTARIFLVLHGG